MKAGTIYWSVYEQHYVQHELAEIPDREWAAMYADEQAFMTGFDVVPECTALARRSA